MFLKVLSTLKCLLRVALNNKTKINFFWLKNEKVTGFFKKRQRSFCSLGCFLRLTVPARALDCFVLNTLVLPAFWSFEFTVRFKNEKVNSFCNNKNVSFINNFCCHFFLIDLWKSEYISKLAIFTKISWNFSKMNQ